MGNEKGMKDEKDKMGIERGQLDFSVSLMEGWIVP